RSASYICTLSLHDALPIFYAIIEFDNELPIDFVTYVWSGSQTKKELIDNIKNYKKHSDYKETVYQSALNSENTKIVAKNATHFFPTHSIPVKNEMKELL